MIDNLDGSFINESIIYNIRFNRKNWKLAKRNIQISFLEVSYQNNQNKVKTKYIPDKGEFQLEYSCVRFLSWCFNAFVFLLIFKLRCKYVRGTTLFIFSFSFISDASVFLCFYLSLLAVVEADQQNITQVHFSAFLIFLLLSSLIRVPLHTFLVCDTVFLFHSFLLFFSFFASTVSPTTHSDIRAIFFALSSFLFLSSHRRRLSRD